jgi:RNA polymerase sigma factor (sigma-70 family)
MADESLRILVRRLRRATDPGGDAALSDAQLLERFVTQRDEAAFELLVWRHGTMVLNLCRRVLRQEQDTEDAFQATFLILARKARSIGKRQACGSWLYKVAYRVALAARAESAARVARERPCPDELPAAEASDDLIWRDLRPLLDEEVSRLPEKYRAAFVLCCLEGRTGAEAAEQLRCPEGTVLSRLSRARARLRTRLLSRGVTLPAGVLVAVVAARGQAAEVTAGLVNTTSKAALADAAGKAVATVTSVRAAALTEGVLRAMFVSKVKVTLGVLTTIALVGIGAGIIGNVLLAEPPRPADPPAPAGQPGGPVADPEGVARAADRREEPDDPAKEALRRLQSRRSLKQIGAALHNYAAAYGQLPAPAIYEGYPNGLVTGSAAGVAGMGSGSMAGGPGTAGGGGSAPGGAGPSAGGSAPAAGAGSGGATSPGPGGADVRTPAVGRPLLSWRVEILPFLGEQELYKLFKRDEPWDSEHNKKLLARMPAVYAPPGAKDGDRTYYQAIVGAEAAWEPRQAMRFPASIPDGTSNTLLVVEAATPVPWTKPEDLAYVPDQALPKFGGLFGGDFHALFADGAVHFISAKADETNLRAAITRAGGEVIDLDKLLVAGSGGLGARVNLADLPAQNRQLREAVDSARKEVAKERDELELLKARAASGAAKIDAKQAQLLKENVELQKTLDQVLEELAGLRTERQRLQQGLDQSAPKEKVRTKKP